MYSRMDGLMPLCTMCGTACATSARVANGARTVDDLGEPGLDLHRDLGRDGQGALRADEQLGQVVAARALDELAAGAQHGAVGQHHLEPEHVVAGHAVADGAHAAGVGGHVPAERAALLARRDRVDEAERRQLAVELLERHAGLDHGDLVLGVDLEDPLHAVEGQQDAVGHRARRRPRARCRCPGRPPARRARWPAAGPRTPRSVEPGQHERPAGRPARSSSASSWV